ncbi:MAG: CDP-diacylglycerol--serine O-phosphatidyltransferase [Alphaproteobacteria bacterium]|jgi:CDP-diacylglycerol--serine O-phosphatidyltransferase|nr:CDP-diacylglycerol--serine O-phosphatidyltransferase [Alphaproteobacteria bacterium]
MLKKSRKRRRRKRPTGQTFTRLIPHIITVGALCAGLTGVRFALDEKWEYAVIAIAIAAVLDTLDGAMARLLKSASDFGAELDSLSDVIAFGVAPAMIVYFWSLSAAGGVAWAAALFFAVCCALRLARFNSTMETRPPWAYNYFSGVPAPAGALMALAPIIISFEIGRGYLDHPMVAGIWLTVVALLMVSRLPTYSFKQFKVPHRYIVPMLVLIGFLVAGLSGSPWVTLVICGGVYVGSFPFSARSYERLRRAAEQLQDESKDDGDDGDSSGEEPAEEPRPAHLRPV